MIMALLCVMFSCDFVTFPCGVQGQVWYLIVVIPDPYFYSRDLRERSVTLMPPFAA